MSIDNKVQTVETRRRVNVQVYSCDGCGVEAVKAQVVLNNETVVPRGSGIWFEASRIELSDAAPPDRLHFCSRECLTEWLDNPGGESEVPEVEVEATSSRQKAKEAVPA